MDIQLDEEPTGPSVDSEDAEERILARRMRIQRRQEAQKKALLGEEDDEVKEVEQHQTVSQKQREESYARLKKLLEDGFEMVSNIRVAGDAREIARRLEEEESRRQRKERLEAEAKAGAERFEEITKKWELALQKEIPQELHEMLTQQKTACDAMLDEKNKLITDYQAELKAKDDQYVRDLKNQAEDIDLLIERMDSQIVELAKAYRRELEEIEKACVLERTELLEQHQRKWEQMMAERQQKEVDYMTAREQRVDEYEQQLQEMRIQDAEEYNQVKIKLETDVQILQQQLQQMKATYQLNQEKLEYNFQVLRKRDEENTITKSQQKRKITRLHDVFTNLKRKYDKQEKQYRDDNQQLTSDFKHQLEQFRDVQKKAQIFMGSDAKKFNHIWVMNEEECKKLAQSILEADRIINEQQLGLPWSPPPLEFMNNVGPIVTGKDGRSTAKSKKLAERLVKTSSSAVESQASADADRADNASSVASSNASSAAVAEAALSEFSPRLTTKILELLCDESGFLIDSKVLMLLAPQPQCDQTVMKLDSIFMALGIESDDDVKLLTSYFLKHRTATSRDVESVASTPSSSSHSERDERAELAEADTPDQLDEPSGRGSHVTGGEAAGDEAQLIDANDVLRALKAFVEENNKQRVRGEHEIALEQLDNERIPTPERESLSGQAASPPSRGGRNSSAAAGDDVATASTIQTRPLTTMQQLLFEKSEMSSQFNIVNVNERDGSSDDAYWSNYHHIISTDKDQVWDGLLYTLNKYLGVLQSRAKLIDETDAMRRQNAELRILLHQYVNSQVNKEMEIPPTRTLQFDQPTL